MIQLRNAQATDCQSLFEWRNDPTSIQFSPSGSVNFDDHQRWFAQKINDPQTIIKIITHNQKDVGMIRADLTLPTARISINLDLAHRSKGIGTKSLKYFLRVLFTENLGLKFVTAEYMPENTASRRLFLNLGFCEDNIDALIHSKIQREIFLNDSLEFGAKIWSHNKSWFDDAIKSYKAGEIQFLEMYALPNSFDEDSFEKLIASGIPVQIHSPNEDKMNLTQNNAVNMEYMSEVIRFADYFQSDYIIVHSGIGKHAGYLMENLKKINDPRLIIENVPYASLLGKEPLYAHHPQIIEEILSQSTLGFCLDFTHATKAAISFHEDPMEIIRDFIKLKPTVYHITDGRLDIEEDEHLDLGKGEFDLSAIKDIILNHAGYRVVLETPKTGHALENDIKNIQFFKNI